MTNIIRLETESDRAFEAWIAARKAAFESGSREDADRAARLFGVFEETFLPRDRRWPRDPVSLRPLAPSEIARGRK